MKENRETTNHEGGVAYELSPELELYSQICCSTLQPQFYVPNTNDQLNKIKSLMRKNDPMFCAQLAVYARERMNLRDIPSVIAVELAKIHSGDSLVSKLVNRVVQRPDEIIKLLEHYQKANQRKGQRFSKKLNKLSSQIQKGLRKIFESDKFNEYHLAKYNRGGDIKLKDALFLSHPKAQNIVMDRLFKKLVGGYCINSLTQTNKCDCGSCEEMKLDIPKTWETEMSKAGQSDDRSKKEVWEEMIDSNKMGYMATLRNLRNFLQEHISIAHIRKVADVLADPNRVVKSKQLPFRFLSAYRMIVGGQPSNRWDNDWDTDTTVEIPVYNRKTEILVKALEDAVKASVVNIPMFDRENVLVACDVSGSMQMNLSERSVVQRFDIGTMLAMLLAYKCEKVVAGMFGDSWKILNFKKSNILQNANEIHNREGEVGYSTNGYKVLDWALQMLSRNIEFDRIMMFTDAQMYGGRYNEGNEMERKWQEYKSAVPGAKLYLFDLAGYGTTPINMKDGDVYLIAGWNDKIFEVLASIEAGDDTLDEIKSIKL